MDSNYKANSMVQKPNMKVTFIKNDLGSVRSLALRMPQYVKENFMKNYGGILNLLNITVEAPMLSALTQYWSISLKCFELPFIDIAPTIEEYGRILRLPIGNSPKVYLYGGHYAAEWKIAKIVKIPAELFSIEERGQTRGIKKTILERHSSSLADQEDWDSFSKTLALLIFGLILFPFSSDMIDLAAMDVFFKYETNQENPVPAILADTFITMDIFHQKGVGMIKCSTHMLFVWLIPHLCHPDHTHHLFDPLMTFNRVPIKKQSPQDWKEEFKILTEDSFRWVAPWFRGEEVILSCGSYPIVPLMGARGCTFYNPTLVLRQLNWTQHIPRESHPDSHGFLHGEGSKKLEKNIREAWRNPHWVGANILGIQVISATPEYKQWRQARMGSNVTTPVRQNEAQVECVSQMTKQIERLEAQVKTLMLEKEAANFEVDMYKSQCQKLKGKIENLKDEQADASSSQAKRVRVESIGAERELLMLKNKVASQERDLLRAIRDKKDLQATIVRQEKNLGALEREISQKDFDSEQRVEQATASLNNRLTLSKEREERLKFRLGLLKMEVNEWESEAHHYQKEGIHWRGEAEKYATEKEEIKDYCRVMTCNLYQHSEEFVDRFERVNLCIHCQLAPDVAEFMNHCQDLIPICKKWSRR